MEDNRKYELDALLVFIRNKRYELLRDCRAYKSSIDNVLAHDYASPRNKDEYQQGFGPTPNQEDVIRISDIPDIQQIDTKYKYLDVTEFWE